MTLQKKFAFKLNSDPDQMFFAEYNEDTSKYYVYWTEGGSRKGVEYSIVVVNEFVTKNIWIIQDEA